jgi:membrane-associated phospholipid phosphatase
VCVAVYLLDLKRRHRLLDGALAVAITAALYQPLKILIGRPRPRFHDPLHFCGPFTAYPLPRPDPLNPEQTVLVARHSWEVWGHISSDLWSMPSSHTAAAMAMSVILSRLYPRVVPLVMVLAVVVGVCRVLFGSHYPSDVVLGAGIGYVAASLAMHNQWGQRLAPGLARKVSDSGAKLEAHQPERCPRG